MVEYQVSEEDQTEFLVDSVVHYLKKDAWLQIWTCILPLVLLMNEDKTIIA